MTDTLLDYTPFRSNVAGRIFRITLLLVTLSFSIQAQVYSSVEDVPNPKELGTGFVSDASGLLTSVEMDSLNHLLAELNRTTGVETAIVLVPDFREDEEAFQFATDLFRHWGIGKHNSDNGLLLFIATNRRQYRFVTGYGLEGLLPDARLKAVGERMLVPAFRKEAYGAGILASLRVITAYLQQPEHQQELEELMAQYEPSSTTEHTPLLIFAGLLASYGLAAWQTFSFKKTIKDKPRANRYLEVAGLVTLTLIGLSILAVVIFIFVGNFQVLTLDLAGALPYLTYLLTSIVLFLNHLHVLSNLRQQYRDDDNFLRAVQQFYGRVWWQVLIWPVTAIYLILEKVRFRKSQPRFLPQLDATGQAMKRLNRDEHPEAAAHLSAGQLQEEKMNSQVYDIWQGNDGTFRIVPNASDTYQRHLTCPACGFRTLSEPINIPVTKATEHSRGTARRVRRCRHCQHEEFIRQVMTPTLTRSRSASGSSSSSSGHSSCSSSSSSWSGGSSGGGGAGGSW